LLYESVISLAKGLVNLVIRVKKKIVRSLLDQGLGAGARRVDQVHGAGVWATESGSTSSKIYFF